VGVSGERERRTAGECPRPFTMSSAARARGRACFAFLLVLMSFITVASIAADASIKLERSVEFGGGAIVDFAPADESTVVLLGAMPDGFSIFGLDFATGAVTKLVSQTYLSRLVGEDADSVGFTLHLDPSTGLLILLSRSPEHAPVALNISEAPYLKRYRLGIPEDFAASGVVFHLGSAYFHSHLVSGGGGVTPLLVFDPAEQRLSELKPARKFSIVRGALPTSEDKRVLTYGFFVPEAMLSTYKLAWLDLSTGEISVLPGSDRTVIAATAGNRLALVRQSDAHVAMGDEPLPVCRLELLDLKDTMKAVGRSIPLYSRPEWIGLTPDGEWVLISSTSDGVRCDLWLIRTSTRSKELVRKGILAVRMSPLGKGFFVLPADKNAVERYAFADVAF